MMVMVSTSARSGVVGIAAAVMGGSGVAVMVGASGHARSAGRAAVAARDQAARVVRIVPSAQHVVMVTPRKENKNVE